MFLSLTSKFIQICYYLFETLALRYFMIGSPKLTAFREQQNHRICKSDLINLRLKTNIYIKLILKPLTLTPPAENERKEKEGKKKLMYHLSTLIKQVKEKEKEKIIMIIKEKTDCLKIKIKTVI